MGMCGDPTARWSSAWERRRGCERACGAAAFDGDESPRQFPERQLCSRRRSSSIAGEMRLCGVACEWRGGHRQSRRPPTSVATEVETSARSLAFLISDQHVQAIAHARSQIGHTPVPSNRTHTNQAPRRTLYTHQCIPTFGIPHVLAASQTHPKATATAAVPGKANARGYERLPPGSRHPWHTSW